MKTKTIIAICLIALTLGSCKKEAGPKGDTGATGAQGATGPAAKTFNFSLTFDAGETFESYDGITGFKAGDIVMTYIKYETLLDEAYWTQLPLVFSNTVNFVPEFNEKTGYLFINTDNADGSAGSPWTSSTTIDFKAVLITVAQQMAHPNVNWEDYNEVKQALDIKE
jgi:hypothetical protein